MTYPYGYSGDTVTLEQLRQKQTFRRLHPEFQRRFIALADAAANDGVALGVGTGWRSSAVQAAGYARDPKGFAKPGHSNHEGFGPADIDAVAIDCVPATAWKWTQANCARFGIRTFAAINNEPWHLQPAEIPASRTRRATSWHLARVDLGDAAPPPVTVETPTAPTSSFDPANRAYGLYPLDASKQVLRPGTTGDAVRYLQGVMVNEVFRFAAWFLATGQADSESRTLYLTACRDTAARLGVDGDYGPATADAVEFMQRAFGDTAYDGRVVGPLTADGTVGKAQTWPFVDSLSDGTWA